MKRIFPVIFIVLLISAFAVMADDFNGIWKTYGKSEEKDLPATQIEILDNIISKAKEEKSYGNLLKAIKERLEKRYLISPDSFKADVNRLEKETEDINNYTALYAVYNSLLGSIYKEEASESYGDRTGQKRLLEKSKLFFNNSLKNPDALAKVKTTELYPFFSNKNGNDLLVSLSYNAGSFNTAREYYIKTNNRPCALIMSLEALKKNRNNDNRYLASLDSLINIYSDIDECCEAAIAKYNYINEMTDTGNETKIKFIRESIAKWGKWKRASVLKNAELRLTRPSFETELSDTQIAEGDNITLSLKKVRNVSKITTKVWKTKLTTSDIIKQQNKGRLDDEFYKNAVKSSSKKSVRVLNAEFDSPDYEFNDKSFDIGPLEKGIYIVETKCNVKSIRPIYNLVYVSNLYVISESLPNNKVRFAVVDSRSGQPVSNAMLTLYCRNNNFKLSAKDKTCNADGELVYNDTDIPYMAFAYDDNDKYMYATRVNHSFGFYEKTNDNSHTAIFTDRSIYRPGQIVKVAVVSYKDLKGRDLVVEKNKSVKVSLSDANYKVISEKELTTDEYGKASAEFVLPKKTLSGNFRISCSNNGYASIRVEEYKRPTFEVEFSKVSNNYKFGDTVKVRVTATSFSGVPVQGASVKYTIKRLWSPWLRFYGSNSNDIIARGNSVTSGEGTFAVDVPLNAVADKKYGYYNFVVEADVTDASGETRHGSISIPVSEKNVWFGCDLPEKIESSKLRNIKFEVKNTAGNNIDTDVTFSIDGKKGFKVKSNTDINLDKEICNLPSGRHTLKATAMGEKIEKEFIIFSLHDKVPATKTDDWFYLTSETFPTDGSGVFIQIGSSRKDVHVLYSVISGKNVLKSGTISLNNEVKTFEIKYKEEFGDGILIDYAWVKDGRLFTHRATIKKALPEKRLNIKWVTFRDRLTPGQKEQWTLNISRSDSTKADASLIATLYDMSLDNIIPYSWRNIYGLSRYIPYTGWTGTNSNDIQRDYSRAEIKWYYEDIPLYEKIPQINRMFAIREMANDAMLPATRNNLLYKSMGTSSIEKSAENVESAVEEETSKESTPQLRENLNETAFFYPSLTTDKDGNVNISFTLPESITTWKFMAFANDKDMRNEVFTDEAIAQKKVMIQPNMPRFIRRGDDATISARIFNLSEKDIKGKAVMQICDAETDKLISEKITDFNISKDGTGSVTFDYTADTEEDIVVCKVFAKGKDYSDGEQHYLNVLSDKEMVTNTRVITKNEAGNYDIDTKDLFGNNTENRRLTVEYTDNPAWYVIQALPSVIDNNKDDAISIAISIYANSLAKHIAVSSPEIKNIVKLWGKESDKENSLTSNLQKNSELKNMILEETPWINEAENETEQKHRISELFDENLMNNRLDDAVKKLSKLQHEDGSWGWWPGMKGNVYITTSIAEMLVRLEVMTGKNSSLSIITDMAMKYLSDEAVKEVKYARNAKDYKITPTGIKYLYLKSLRDTKYNDADKWLMSLLGKNKNSDFTIYGKAMAAIIFHKTGNNDRALQLINSIKEYSVADSEMGRYFDTTDAEYSWCDYKIPTEVMAIEALQTVTLNDKETIAEMQKWLLQEKRTTSWSTPINSANAIYAFTNNGNIISVNSEKSVITLDGKEIKGAKAGTGYLRFSKEGNDFNLNLNKKQDGMSWLSLYGTYTSDVKDIIESSTGLKVKREIISGSNVKVGNRIKVRITITADRDYDFVQVSDKRAACMEPVNQISGYNGRYYCSMKDNAAHYYFDIIPKGTHVIENEYYVDRKGSYTTGTCTVQCAYAPEFNARTEAKTIRVK